MFELQETIDTSLLFAVSVLFAFGLPAPSTAAMRCIAVVIVVYLQLVLDGGR